MTHRTTSTSLLSLLLTALLCLGAVACGDDSEGSDTTGNNDNAAVTQGQELFMSTGCVGCHNADGTPSALANDKGLKETDDRYSSEEIATIIREGIDGTSMISYSSQLDETDIANVVAFIESID